MPSGLRNTSGNQFEIYYEQPWGGVASDKSYVDIEPNQLVSQQGVVISSGKLEYLNFVADQFRFTWNVVAFGGTTPINAPPPAGAFPYLLFEFAGEIWAVDQFGYIYNYENVDNLIPGDKSGFYPATSGSFPTVSYIIASDGPWVVGATSNIPTAAQVINGVAYIAVASRNSIYTFDGTLYTLASTYTGGNILGVLDDYLLQLNTNSAVDGLQPNRINWSGPGKFTTWDPAADRTAGFNTLAAVDDQLTGFLSFASVGVAISQKGLIELSPTGVAIGPFQFTALWTSKIGQGSIYPNSITQYGLNGYLASEDGVYKVSTGGGFQDVSGTARKAILSSFNQTATQVGTANGTEISGAILLYAYNSKYITPYYVLATIAKPNAAGVTASVNLTLWVLDTTTGTWTELVYDAPTLLLKGLNITDPTVTINYARIYTFQLTPIAVPSFTVAPTVFSNAVTIIVLGLNTASGNKIILLTPYLYNNLGTVDTDVNYTGNLNLIFRGEEIKLERQPTIRRVVVRAYGTGNLVCSVNGASFGTIALDGTATSKAYICPSGVYTGQAPQLKITSSNFKGVIEKVMLAGTYADGDID